MICPDCHSDLSTRAAWLHGPEQCVKVLVKQRDEARAKLEAVRAVLEKHGITPFKIRPALAAPDEGEAK